LSTYGSTATNAASASRASSRQTIIDDKGPAPPTQGQFAALRGRLEQSEVLGTDWPRFGGNEKRGSSCSSTSLGSRRPRSAANCPGGAVPTLSLDDGLARDARRRLAAFVAVDPYVLNGLVESWTVTPGTRGGTAMPRPDTT